MDIAVKSFFPGKHRHLEHHEVMAFQDEHAPVVAKEPAALRHFFSVNDTVPEWRLPLLSLQKCIVYVIADITVLRSYMDTVRVT